MKHSSIAGCCMTETKDQLISKLIPVMYTCWTGVWLVSALTGAASIQYKYDDTSWKAAILSKASTYKSSDKLKLMKYLNFHY